MNRREFLTGTAALGAGAMALEHAHAQTASASTTPSTPPASGARPGHPIAVSTYSYWRYRNDSKLTIEDCIRLAAEMGFDGVEVLEIQMERKDAPYLQSLKRQALAAGLHLAGLSAHQSFVSPKPEERKANIDKTIASIELAYALGISAMRVNTGRWGTSKDFDELMKNRGIEPPLPGFKDEDAFPWVIEALEKCLPVAEKCGVVLGLENHWGLARTPEGLMRIINAVPSPWLGVNMDTGNFLEDPYAKLEQVVGRATWVHAKFYWGGGTWYTLDLDYQRIAALVRKANYRGFISLEYEGKEDSSTAVPKSLAVLRQEFRW